MLTCENHVRSNVGVHTLITAARAVRTSPGGAECWQPAAGPR